MDAPDRTVDLDGYARRIAAGALSHAELLVVLQAVYVVGQHDGFVRGVAHTLKADAPGDGR